MIVKPELTCPQGAWRVSRGPAAPSPTFGVASSKQVSGQDRTEPMGRVVPAQQPDPAQTWLRGSPRMKGHPAFLMGTAARHGFAYFYGHGGFLPLGAVPRAVLEDGRALFALPQSHPGL